MREVPDVLDVHNEIVLDESGGVTDYAADIGIANLIRARIIENDLLVADKDVKRIVVNGSVYVIGTAPDAAARDKLLDVLRSTTGVQRVVSYVRPATQG